MSHDGLIADAGGHGCVHRGGHIVGTSLAAPAAEDYVRCVRADAWRGPARHHRHHQVLARLPHAALPLLERARSAPLPNWCQVHWPVRGLPSLSWASLLSGSFSSFHGSVIHAGRRLHFSFATVAQQGPQRVETGHREDVVGASLPDVLGVTGPRGGPGMEASLPTWLDEPLCPQRGTTGPSEEACPSCLGSTVRGNRPSTLYVHLSGREGGLRPYMRIFRLCRLCPWLSAVPGWSVKDGRHAQDGSAGLAAIWGNSWPAKVRKSGHLHHKRHNKKHMHSGSFV